MLKKFFNTFFNSRNDRLLNQYSKKVTLINELEPKLKKLKDGDFKVKTKEFKERYKSGEKLEDLIVEVLLMFVKQVSELLGCDILMFN